jgi:hypothetical protein
MSRRQTSTLIFCALVVIGLVSVPVRWAWEFRRSSAFRTAIADRDVSAVRQALIGGVDPNQRWVPYHDALLPPPPGSETPLHLAVVNDSPAIVQLLLAHGADPHTLDPEGTPLLTLAEERSEIKRLLLQAKAKR